MRNPESEREVEDSEKWRDTGKVVQVQQKRTASVASHFSKVKESEVDGEYSWFVAACTD